MSKAAAQPAPIEVEATELGPCHHRIAVKVPATRVREEFEHTYRKLARRVKVPGFRPGKAPPEVLRKRLGEGVVEDAREHLFEHIIGEAIQQAGLEELRVLDFDPKAHPVSEDSELVFEFQIESAPVIDLPPWEEVRIEARPTEPDAKQLHEALEALGRENPCFEEAKAGVCDGDHMAEADLAYTREGEEGPTAEGVRLSLSSPLYGADPEAFSTALQGARAGDELRVPVEFMEGFAREDWVGKKGEALIRVKRIVSARPATPAEAAGALGLESEEQLREKVAEGLLRENEGRERSRQVNAILDTLHGLRPFELPPRLLEEETEAAVTSHAERLEKQAGLSREEAAAQAGQAREQIAEDAERRLRHWFLVRRVAAAEGLRVTEGDLQRAYRMLAARHQADPKAVRAYYEEKGLVRSLARDILEDKVRAGLLERVEIAPAASAE